MSDPDKQELRLLRRVVKQFGGCGVAQRLDQGWVTRLLRDEVRDQYKAAGLEFKETNDDTRPAGDNG